MPSFFSSCCSAVSQAPYSSTQGHRNAERGNAATELLGTALQSFNPALLLPQTLAQTLISAYSIFRSDTHFPEKVIHFIQMGLAASQMAFGIKLLFDSAICNSTATTICQAVFLTQLLYKGTLLVGWLPSEFSKDPYVDPIAAAIPAGAVAPVAPAVPPLNQAPRRVVVAADEIPLEPLVPTSPQINRRGNGAAFTEVVTDHPLVSSPPLTSSGRSRPSSSTGRGRRDPRVFKPRPTHQTAAPTTNNPILAAHSVLVPEMTPVDEGSRNNGQVSENTATL